MSEEKVFDGRSEEEALLKASQELGVNISDMVWEVVEEDTSLFGLFKRGVKVRVRIKEDAIGRASPPRERESGQDGEVAEGDAQAEDGAPAKVGKGPQARRALEGLLQRMGVDATVEMSEREDAVYLNVRTDDSAMVVGKNGELLSAIQFIVNKMVNRFPEDRKRVVVDSSGFRGRREEKLAKLATELARKVTAKRRAISVAPMNAQDRRLIHTALKEVTEVTTFSEGEGILRRLLIVPSRAENPDNRERHKKTGNGQARDEQN